MTVRILRGHVLDRLRRSQGGSFMAGIHAYRVPQPHWEREWMICEYVERSRSCSEIAASIGCTEANVLFWLRKHGIPRRSVSEARQVKRWGAAGEANPMFGKVGPLNPRYVDGGSPERQRLFAQAAGKEFRLAVFCRDGFRCVRCLAGKRGARSLHAHHIVPWAGNPALRFEVANAVTLCRPCHHWVHSKQNAGAEYLA